MDDTSRQRGNDLAATGRLVAANIKTARQPISLRDLSDRLAAVGHSISPSSLQKIEAGRRRVDVDDLMALAFVLNVNPHALLVEAGEGELDVASATGVGDVRAEDLWAWLDGERPLYASDEDPRAFTGRTRPVWKRTVGDTVLTPAAVSALNRVADLPELLDLVLTRGTAIRKKADEPETNQYGND